MDIEVEVDCCGVGKNMLESKGVGMRFFEG